MTMQQTEIRENSRDGRRQHEHFGTCWDSRWERGFLRNLMERVLEQLMIPQQRQRTNGIRGGR